METPDRVCVAASLSDIHLMSKESDTNKEQFDQTEETYADYTGTTENPPYVNYKTSSPRCSYALKLGNGEQGTAKLDIYGYSDTTNTEQIGANEVMVKLDPNLMACRPDELGSLIVVRRKDYESIQRNKKRTSESGDEEGYVEMDTTPTKTSDFMDTPSNTSDYDDILSINSTENSSDGMKRLPPALPPRNSGMPKGDQNVNVKRGIERQSTFSRAHDDFIPDKTRLLFKGLAKQTTDLHILHFLTDICNTSPKCLEKGSNDEAVIVVFDTLPG